MGHQNQNPETKNKKMKFPQPAMDFKKPKEEEEKFPAPCGEMVAESDFYRHVTEECKDLRCVNSRGR